MSSWVSGKHFTEEAISLSLFNVFLCTNLINDNQKRFRCAKASTTNQNSSKTLIFIHPAIKLFWCYSMARMWRYSYYYCTGFHRFHCNRNTLFLTGVWNLSQGSTNLSDWQHCIPHFTAGKTGFQWGNFTISFSRRPERPAELNCSSRTQEHHCCQMLNPLTPRGISYSLLACNEIFMTFLFEKVLQITAL